MKPSGDLLSTILLNRSYSESFSFRHAAHTFSQSSQFSADELLSKFALQLKHLSTFFLGFGSECFCLDSITVSIDFRSMFLFTFSYSMIQFRNFQIQWVALQEALSLILWVVPQDKKSNTGQTMLTTIWQVFLYKKRPILVNSTFRVKSIFCPSFSFMHGNGIFGHSVLGNLLFHTTGFYSIITLRINIIS